ncbi:MAG: hypothetical protein HY562_08215 [Ignavibacteriales bacterium]|nr:hypothetical protein [Ignavibacteriales bacterium]
MGRRILYKIEDNSQNSFTEDQWTEVGRMQHWYNSEFKWSLGKIAFKRYVIFPNAEEFANLDQSVWQIIAQRHHSLHEQGMTDHEIVEQLERDRLVFVKWGGYFDNCLASGFTRVADNEWNAFLVCDFLLKVSTLCPDMTIHVVDEGQFVKTGEVWVRRGEVYLRTSRLPKSLFLDEMIQDKHIFSIVNPDKYNNHPAFKNVIPEFNRLHAADKLNVVRRWNWLGYGDGYDASGDDATGFNLNLKVRRFHIVD